MPIPRGSRRRREPGTPTVGAELTLEEYLGRTSPESSRPDSTAAGDGGPATRRGDLTADSRYPVPPRRITTIAGRPSPNTRCIP
jgi:hypothetical protein